MITTKPEKPAPDLILQVDQHLEKLDLIGPSFHGWLYRSREKPYCYRVLPHAEMKLPQRQEVQTWIGKHFGSGLAPITRVWQPHDLAKYYVVQYEIKQLDRTLAEALTDPEASRRINYAARVLRALPGWWQQLWSPLLLMPTDIVFAQNGQTFMLPFPKGPLPQVEQIFDAPDRILYLAPELVRGTVMGTWENLDRYALGVALLQCFGRISLPAEASEHLLDAARGDILAPRRVVSRLPFWLERLAATQQALAQVRRLVAPEPAVRQAVDLKRLADRLQKWQEQMNPLTAARELRDADQVLEAFDFLQQTLLTQESYELLLLAGQLAGKYLKRPLEAIDFLERAIIKEPDRPEAYEEQFRVIAAGRHHRQLCLLIDSNNPRKAQIDALLLRDFDKLPPERQQSQQLAKASYLLWRQRFEEAAKFIYPLIVRTGNRDNTLEWWKFGLNLAYGEALLGLGKLQDAQRYLQVIRDGLAWARDNANIDIDEYQNHHQTLADLTARLNARMAQERDSFPER